jgi:O-acetyl-ADP-ribose deacetylase (regulator of RNase III)
MQVTAELGDITTVDADAIVNAANSSLLGGGGVDGAIHRAAGPELLAACQALRRTTLRNGLAVGDAVVTEAFRLPARWVIHTVGPNRHAGETDPELLASCFRRSLDVASDVHARSVAFPAISAGLFGWDADAVARIAAATVQEWEQATHDHAGVERVRFVLFSDQLLQAFEDALASG